MQFLQFLGLLNSHFLAIVDVDAWSGWLAVVDYASEGIPQGVVSPGGGNDTLDAGFV